MAFSSWIASLFCRAPCSPRPSRPPSPCCRPALEWLEDRLAPATLTVNTLTDFGGGSQLTLRAAIQAVDNGSYSGSATSQVSGTFGSNDTILFQSGLNGTLSLTASGPLVISSNVTIIADPTLNAITISGLFAGSQTGVFEVTSPATATIAGLTITQGKDSTNLFGGIDVQAGAALTVNGCTFVDNQSAGSGGGAILNAGTLTVINSTFNANSGVVGGAIDNVSGAMATLINCTISGNQATTSSGTGGGVANAGSLTLLNTLIAQNTSAGSDPDVVGAFTSSGHNLIGNATGSTGLTNGVNGDQVSSAAPFTGDLTSGLATIANVSSTAGLMVGQLVTDSAGAIPAGTVIAVLGPHTITLSRVASKSQTGDTFTSSVCANLGPLQDNGGGIQTMAPLPTSPAIDAGANSDAVLTVPATDQRGVSRPQAGTVDIGAFEANQLLVTNIDDSGAGSLRDALTQSNSIPGTVLIDFQAGLAGTISLTTGHLEIVHNDWIRGPGASQITVDGNLHFWCFGVNSQYLDIGDLHTAIYGLTMTRGEQTQGISDGRGGAISYRHGFPADYHLTVKDCVIENSVNDGIYAEDRLSVSNCQIINNTGHGININGDDLDVSNSWLANNTIHGINSGVNAVLTNCTLSGNKDHGIRGGHSQILTNCTVTGNNSGVEVTLDDIGIYTNCTIVGNITEDARTVVGPPPQYHGNMIFANSIVGKMVVQFGIFTSQGNNIFTGGLPGTLQSSDVVAPVISSLHAGSGGTLVSGKFYYEVSAVTSTGTLTSLESSVTVGAKGKVTISWKAPVGTPAVSSYQIFRGTAAGNELQIAAVSGATTSYVDGGSGASGKPALLLSTLADNGGPVPTMAPTAAGSGYIRSKANPAFAPFLDERGYLRNSLLPSIGAFELNPALPGGTVNIAYNQTQDLTGVSGTYSGVNVTGLPDGLTASLTGTTLTISGTSAVTGTFPLSITLHDDSTHSDRNVAKESLTINPPLAVTTPSLPNWTETLAYHQSIATTGGTAPLKFALSAGTLPAGLSLNSKTGLISGTPSVGSAGSYPFTVEVTDAAGAGVSQPYTVVISAVSLGALSFNQWTINKTGFLGTIAASTGTGAYTFGLASGKLPPGMTDSLSGGLITFAGKPTVAGTYTFALKLTDSLGVIATRTCTLVINPATTFVWTGLGADANWMTPGNWSSAGAAPLAGYTLIFGIGATQKTANDDFPSGTQFTALVFQDSGYTLTGNNLKLSAGISSTSTAGGTDTVALNVALTSNQTFNIAGTALIDVTGTISGTNLGITKTGAGTLAYDSPTGNTYTGLTTVSGGTLQLNSNNQIADTASVAVNVGAVFDLNGLDETIANLTLTGGTVTTGIGTLTLSGNITSNAASVPATIKGQLDLTGATPTLTVNKGTAGNDLVIAASISAGSLTKLGLGTLVLSGNNSSYIGTTKVSSGVLDVPNPASLGSGPVLALGGTTLQLDGNGLTFDNVLTLGSTGGATLTILAGSNTWSGSISDAVTSTINVSAGTLTLSGIISGSGGLTKVGAGSLIVSALNTYTGGTTVKGGRLGGGGKIGALQGTSAAIIAPSFMTTQIFTTGKVAFSAGSTFAVMLNGTTAGIDYDQLSATGTVNLAGATLKVNLGFTPVVGSTFLLIQNDGTDAVVGTFAGLKQGAKLLLSGMTFQISYVGGTGNDVVLTRTA